MDAKLPKPKLMKAKIEIIFESRDTTVDQIEGYEDFYRSLLSDYDGSLHKTLWLSAKVTDCSNPGRSGL
jgi:hypothetical protein